MTRCKRCRCELQHCSLCQRENCYRCQIAEGAELLKYRITLQKGTRCLPAESLGRDKDGYIYYCHTCTATLTDPFYISTCVLFNVCKPECIGSD